MEKLNEIEVFLRTIVQLSSNVNFNQFLEKVDKLEDRYWKQIGLILIYHGAKRKNCVDECACILKKIDKMYTDQIKSYEKTYPSIPTKE